MTLIVISLALVLERLIGGAHSLHNYTWFYRWIALLEQRLPQQAVVNYVLVLLPILLLIFVIDQALVGVWWGLARFVLEVLVLSACLGPRLLDQDVDDYIAARENNESEALAEAVAHITGKAVPEKLSAEVREVTEGIFYQANMRWFAVIFWFLLLGPVGAALYRLTILLRQDDYAAGQVARRIYGILGWLPARISALYFGLMGSMDEALYAFKSVHKNHPNWAEGNRLILAHTGCAAINLEMDSEQDDGQGLSWSAAANWVRRARGLCLRVLMLWLATVAIFTLLGWMV